MPPICCYNLSIVINICCLIGRKAETISPADNRLSSSHLRPDSRGFGFLRKFNWKQIRFDSVGIFNFFAQYIRISDCGMNGLFLAQTSSGTLKPYKLIINKADGFIINLCLFCSDKMPNLNANFLVGMIWTRAPRMWLTSVVKLKFYSNSMRHLLKR